MYRKQKNNSKTFRVNNSQEGESIENKLYRMRKNSEPISEGFGLQTLFTDRAEGVLPETDIRTDKWEYAAEGKDNISKGNNLDRIERHKIGEQAAEGMKNEEKG